MRLLLLKSSQAVLTVGVSGIVSILHVLSRQRVKTPNEYSTSVLLVESNSISRFGGYKIVLVFSVGLMLFFEMEWTRKIFSEIS